MNTVPKQPFHPLIVCAIAVAFFFGCIASSHRTARTLESGQGSFGLSYLQANNLDQPDAEPVKLMGFDARVGFSRGFDGGLAYTLDLSNGNDNAFATVWGDFKVQLTNRDNAVGLPILSLGLMKGYVYDPAIQTHITSFPALLSFRINNSLTATAQYRYEVLSEGFIPVSFEDPRSVYGLGFSVALADETSGNWIPRVGLFIGSFNSLTGGSDGDQGLVLNLGLTLDSPLSP
jgi:hypothetical protein